MQTTQIRFALCAVLIGSLAACGGGGGGGGPSAAVATSLTAVVPASGMSWATSNSFGIDVTVLSSSNAPVSGAAVRVFEPAVTGPDGQVPVVPIPKSLLVSGVTNSQGTVHLDVQAASVLANALVVVASGSLSTQSLVTINSSALSATLTLPSF